MTLQISRNGGFFIILQRFMLVAMMCLPLAAVHTGSANAGDAPTELPPVEIYDSQDKFVSQDEYIEPSRENLAKLMWALGVHKLSDNVAIDNYLLITECNLYQRFFTHDIEWTRIRDATREYLNQNMSTFPRTFEVMVPIELERYNEEDEYFALTENSSMDNLRRLRFTMSGNNNMCGERRTRLPNYPRELVLILNRPFSLEKIPVSRELATLYLEEARRQIEDLPLRLRNKYYERMAFLRAKVKIITFKEMGVDRGEPLGVVYAEIDGIEVYADTQKIKLLYKQDVQKKSARELRRERMTGRGGDDKITFGLENEEHAN